MIKIGTRNNNNTNELWHFAFFAFLWYFRFCVNLVLKNAVWSIADLCRILYLDVLDAIQFDQLGWFSSVWIDDSTVQYPPMTCSLSLLFFLYYIIITIVWFRCVFIDFEVVDGVVIWVTVTIVRQVDDTTMIPQRRQQPCFLCNRVHHSNIRRSEWIMSSYFISYDLQLIQLNELNC